MKTAMELLMGLVSMVHVVFVSCQSLSMRFARNLTPADHLSLRYERWTNSKLNVAVGGFMEQSRKNNLNLSVYGAELLTEYASNRVGYEAGAFGFRAGLGASWQIEQEPWLYKDWTIKERSSLGLLGEVSGEWFMTDKFSLRLSTQQKFLLNQLLGRQRFLIGLSLVYKLSDY